MTAGLIAHLNAGLTAPAYSIRVGGQELIGRIKAETIQTDEVGFGGVSSMSFIIVDESKTVTLAEGDWV